AGARGGRVRHAELLVMRHGPPPPTGPDGRPPLPVLPFIVHKEGRPAASSRGESSAAPSGGRTPPIRRSLEVQEVHRRGAVAADRPRTAVQGSTWSVAVSSSGGSSGRSVEAPKTRPRAPGAGPPRAGAGRGRLRPGLAVASPAAARRPSPSPARPRPGTGWGARTRNRPSTPPAAVTDPIASRAGVAESSPRIVAVTWTGK